MRGSLKLSLVALCCWLAAWSHLEFDERSGRGSWPLGANTRLVCRYVGSRRSVPSFAWPLSLYERLKIRKNPVQSQSVSRFGLEASSYAGTVRHWPKLIVHCGDCQPGKSRGMQRTVQVFLFSTS